MHLPEYAVSKNKTGDEIGPAIVTLSEAKGLSRGAARCFAAAQHDRAVIHTASWINVLHCIIDADAPSESHYRSHLNARQLMWHTSTNVHGDVRSWLAPRHIRLAL